MAKDLTAQILQQQVTELSALAKRLFELNKLDLGVVDDYSSSPCCESSPAKKRFPSLYIYGRDGELDIPEDGKAVIEYRVTSKSTNKDTRDGKTKVRHSSDIEVHSIEPVKEKRDPETARLMNDLREAVCLDSRPRNSMGQYQEAEGDQITPEQVHAAYRKGAVTGSIAGLAGAPLLGRILRKTKKAVGGIATAAV